MTPLEKAILATIHYFDIFEYPLTAMEIWKWLTAASYDPQSASAVRSAAYAEVLSALADSRPLSERIETKHGFYFLSGRSSTVETRMDRYRLAEQKFYRAKRFIKILRFVPFIKMIGVCNTLAYANSRPEADIDLFIVTRPGRVWQTRFWVAGFLKLFSLRPRPGKTQDTICTSFFVDTDHLDLSSLAIDAHDIYLTYWVAQVVPVYDEGVYRTFLKNNPWVAERLPHYLPYEPTPRRSVRRIRWAKWVLSAICFIFPERLFQGYQQRILPQELAAMVNTDSRVVMRDGVLKFHRNDRRREYQSEWQQRLSTIV